ncbi:hypothetical protein FA13DRAFT_1733822 [Coprinellus micaceus]|uniref:Uncharacterized protein n=1 Tax=Coprinellus micaceus TaxID=71717 RepID=A0A4Y7T967_COPMI|nr:hypothetical protein FA13DRAFT_1733822 [Coprinellus micaceus]
MGRKGAFTYSDIEVSPARDHHIWWDLFGYLEIMKDVGCWVDVQLICQRGTYIWDAVLQLVDHNVHLCDSFRLIR